MLIDQHYTLVREKDGWPGDIGDSCADTARAYLIGTKGLNLKMFITLKGYVRHPTAPDTWRETDFTSDQAAPLLMALDQDDQDAAQEMRNRLSTGKTGDNRPLSLGLYALVKKNYNLLGLATLGQALLFYVPFRYSDAGNLKWYQRFQWGGDAGDYLNWISYVDYLNKEKPLISKLCWMLHSKEKVFGKVQEYYANQPNHSWFLNDYRKHLGVK